MSKKYKFNKDWEKEFPWLTPLQSGRGYCTHCKIDLVPKITIIRRHRDSQSHIKKAPYINHFQPTFKVPGVTVKSVKLKKFELKMAAFSACHTSFRSIDHLGEVMSEGGEGSLLENVKLHRTKVGALTRNVLAPALEDELKNELSKHKAYSILIDETTDFSTSKLLAVLVRHWDSKSKIVVDDLLGLVDVVGTTGEELFLAVRGLLDRYNLDIKDCVSFASDGASNCAGQHNSVWSRFRDANKDCIQIKCICHSLALVVKHAFETHMPDSVAFLIHKIPAHFSKSAIRREEFLELQQVLDEGETSHPFHKYVETRFLVRGKVLKNILKNWESLLVYFEAVKNQVPMETKVEVNKILEILKDKTKYILLTFLVPIIEEFEKLNKKFQVSCHFKNFSWNLY